MEIEHSAAHLEEKRAKRARTIEAEASVAKDTAERREIATVLATKLPVLGSQAQQWPTVTQQNMLGTNPFATGMIHPLNGMAVNRMTIDYVLSDY